MIIVLYSTSCLPVGFWNSRVIEQWGSEFHDDYIRAGFTHTAISLGPKTIRTVPNCYQPHSVFLKLRKSVSHRTLINLPKINTFPSFVAKLLLEF